MKKVLTYLAFLVAGIGIGYLLFFCKPQPNSDEKDRLVKENRELALERDGIMENLLYLVDGYDKKIIEQEEAHALEITKLKQSHNEKRNDILRLSVDSTLQLFAAETH